jgi:hypothetical protein
MVGSVKSRAIVLGLLAWFGYCKKKCLIVNIDNRELKTNVNDNSYAPKTAVLNLDYAKRHGYDFLYVQNAITDVEAETRAKFPSTDIVPPTDNAKDAATAFHVGLKQFRAASWAKLPALWHVTTTMGKRHHEIPSVYSPTVITAACHLQGWTTNTYGISIPMQLCLHCIEINLSKSRSKDGRNAVTM